MQINDVHELIGKRIQWRGWWLTRFTGEVVRKAKYQDDAVLVRVDKKFNSSEYATVSATDITQIYED